MRSYDFPAVDAITIGTVGRPGERVFYVQARAAGEIVTLKIEKAQAAAIAQALATLLEDLPPVDQVQVPSPVDLELVEPVQPAWIVGAVALSNFDEDSGRLLIVFEEAVPEDEDGEEARFGVTQGQMAAMAERAAQLVAGGRPPCPICHFPMNPDGHVCPRSNGHST